MSQAGPDEAEQGAAGQGASGCTAERDAQRAREGARTGDRIFVGRTLEIAQITTALRAGSSVVVKGRAGVGKRALLRQVRAALAGERLCLAPTFASSKQCCADLAEQLHAAGGLDIPEHVIPPRFRAAAARTGRIAFGHIRRSLSRAPVSEQFALIERTLAQRRGVILFADSLELAPTLADMLIGLSEHCQLCAAFEDSNRRARIQRLLWQVQLTVELKPLTREQTRDWLERWLAVHPVAFESPRIRAAFIRAVARDSGGIPAAVTGMLDIALVERTITRESVRAINHEAAQVYLDMTPVLVILSVAFMAMRYVSRGLGMKELMVMAGVGTSMFYLLLFFARFMGAKRR